MPREETLTIPSVEELRAEAPLATIDVAALTITNEGEYLAAGEIRKEVTSRKKAILDKLAPIVAAAHATHKALTTLRNDAIAPYEAIEVAIDPKLTAWERAEKARVEREQREAQERARKEEEERVLRDAVAAEDAGDTELAAAIIEEEIVAPVVYAPPVARVAGMSAASVWGAEVLEYVKDQVSGEMISGKLALVRYVAAHPEWLEFLDVNLPALNARAKRLHHSMNVPGVRAVEGSSRRVKTA